MLMRQSSFPSLSALTGALTGRLGRRTSPEDTHVPETSRDDACDLVLENADGTQSYAHAPRDAAIEADAALLSALRSKIDEGRPLIRTGRSASHRADQPATPVEATPSETDNTFAPSAPVTPRRARRATDAAAQPVPSTRRPAEAALDLAEFATDAVPTDDISAVQSNTATESAVAALMITDADTMVFNAPEDRRRTPLHPATPAPDPAPATDTATPDTAEQHGAQNTDNEDDMLESEEDAVLLGRCAALATRATQIHAAALPEPKQDGDAAPIRAALPTEPQVIPETPTPAALSLHHGAGIGAPDDVINGFAPEHEILLIELTEGRSVPRISFRPHPEGLYTDVVLLQDGVIPARRVIRVTGQHDLKRVDLAFSITARLAA